MHRMVVAKQRHLRRAVARIKRLGGINVQTLMVEYGWLIVWDQGGSNL